LPNTSAFYPLTTNAFGGKKQVCEQTDNRIEKMTITRRLLPRFPRENAWFGPIIPPFALWWIGKSDAVVDGRRLLERFEKRHEPYVRVAYAKVMDEYEKLDVL
jgi:hypothetical protein